MQIALPFDLFEMAVNSHHPAARDSGIGYPLAASGIILPQGNMTLEEYPRLVKQGKGDLNDHGIADLTFNLVLSAISLYTVVLP